MKNKIYLLLVLASLIVAPTLTLAQESGFRTDTSTREERGGRQEDRQEQREDRQAERQTKLSEVMNQRFSNLERMFELRIDWLGNIIGRIESRIAKLQAGGVNTAEMSTKLTSAELSLNAAASKIDGLMTQVQTALESDQPKKNFGALKADIKSLSDEIKAVHKQLVEVITMLKRAVELRQNTASSTATGTN